MGYQQPDPTIPKPHARYALLKSKRRGVLWETAGTPETGRPGRQKVHYRPEKNDDEKNEEAVADSARPSHGLGGNRPKEGVQQALRLIH
jgi:hypothetical protein